MVKQNSTNLNTRVVLPKEVFNAIESHDFLVVRKVGSSRRVTRFDNLVDAVDYFDCLHDRGDEVFLYRVTLISEMLPYE